MKFSVVTYASDLNKAGFLRLKHSAEKHNWPLQVLTGGWLGWGTKVLAVQEWAKTANVDFFMFTDAYDTFFIREYKEEQFLRVCDAAANATNSIYGLISGEKNCWPDQSLAPKYNNHFQDSVWQYANSGQYVINRKLFLQMLEETPIRHTDDDQLWLTHRYLSGKYNLNIDKDCNVFQSIAFEEKGEFGERVSGTFVNNHTGRTAYVLHGNGRTDMSKFEKYI